ncbi:MAG: DNA polymerase III subunit chi [Pseudomonadota bacterium]
MRVDFYELSGRFSDPLFVATVLVGRAWPKSGTVAIVAPRDQLVELDERLWSEPEGRFIPHGIKPATAPIVLAEDAPDRADILINLDPTAPLPGGQFDRVLELVPSDEQTREKLRDRWRGWKQRGAEVNHHVLK